MRPPCSTHCKKPIAWGPTLQALRSIALAAARQRTEATALAAALRSALAELTNNMRAEEQHALPLARAVLTAQDWAEIDRAFLDPDNPDLCQRAQAELHRLFHGVGMAASDPIGVVDDSAGQPQPNAVAGASSDWLLQARDVESCYGRIKALKGINIRVRRGETVALVGANGAGKTTFLRTLSGVQPMSAGSVVFDGEDISQLRSDIRVRRGICQSPEGRQLFNPLSIEDNLRLGAYTRPRRQVEADLESVYGMFPVLKEKRSLAAGHLSGGQQQMLAIGRALMGRPSLLLLDEPSMGLAPLLVQEVFHVIKMLRDQGMTILLVEQNALAALAIADRGYVLETGSVTLTGTGRALIDNEEIRTAYLGM